VEDSRMMVTQVEKEEDSEVEMTLLKKIIDLEEKDLVEEKRKH